MRRARLGRLLPLLVAAPAGASMIFMTASAFAAPPPPPPPPMPAAAKTEAPFGGGAADEIPAPVDEDERVRASHEMPTVYGASGLLHTPSAMTGPAGTFRVAFNIDWFKSSGFLCTSDFPCLGTTNPTTDEHSHIGATAFVSATIVKGLEAYLGTRVYANSNDHSRPNLLQVLGDTALGLKYVAGLGDGLVNLGGGADLLLLNGTGGIGVSGAGTSFRLRALSTFALDKTAAKTPIRIHLGLGYLFDNSGQIVKDVEQARTDRTGTRQDITRLERYGLGINKVDRFEIGLGIEGLLAEDKVRPFLEYTLAIPVNRQNFECQPQKAIPGGGNTDSCLANEGMASFPSKITLGARGFPFKDALSGISFLAAVDIGVTGTSKFIAEVAPQAPYTVWLGMGLSTDSVDKAPKVVEKKVIEKVEVPVGPTLVRLKGFVHEAGTNTPIANAIVTYGGNVDTPLATGADGIFTDDVTPGAYTFTIKADGYKEGACGGTATAPAKKAPAAPAKPGAAAVPPAPVAAPLEIDCALEALPKLGSATITVVDSDSTIAMSAIDVVFTDASGANERKLTSDGNGIIRVTDLAPGFWFAKVEAEGYFVTKQQFEIRIREDTKANIGIRLRPKTSLVTVDKKEVKIKQQVHFATDKAVILGDSVALLEEVADVLIKTPRLKRLEIQGHTDNTGTKFHNQELSQSRAEAVKAFLVKNGVDASRLDAKGYGQDKPVAPNVNEGGRSKNRRVQFLILEQDPEVKPEKKGK